LSADELAESRKKVMAVEVSLKVTAKSRSHLAIACGYEDADDLDHLRKDPAFRLACGRLPDTGNDLCSQPTISRWENTPTLREIVKLSGVLIDLYWASYAAPRLTTFLSEDFASPSHRREARIHEHQDDDQFNGAGALPV